MRLFLPRIARLLASAGSLLVASCGASRPAEPLEAKTETPASPDPAAETSRFAGLSVVKISDFWIAEVRAPEPPPERVTLIFRAEGDTEASGPRLAEHDDWLRGRHLYRYWRGREAPCYFRVGQPADWTERTLAAHDDGSPSIRLRLETPPLTARIGITAKLWAFPREAPIPLALATHELRFEKSFDGPEGLRSVEIPVRTERLSLVVGYTIDWRPIREE